MLNFLIILLFSKTILLTPNFIDIDKGDNYVLNLNESISAITSGATIQIDVSEMVLTGGKKMDILEIHRAVLGMFTGYSIEAELIGERGGITLTYQGSILVNNDSAILVLSGNDVQTGIEFGAVAIKTNAKLERIKIHWKNYKK